MNPHDTNNICPAGPTLPGPAGTACPVVQLTRTRDMVGIIRDGPGPGGGLGHVSADARMRI